LTVFLQSLPRHQSCPFDTLFQTKAIRQSNKTNCHRKFGMNYAQSGHHIMEQLCILTTEGILNLTCLNNNTASILAVFIFLSPQEKAGPWADLK